MSRTEISAFIAYTFVMLSGGTLCGALIMAFVVRRGYEPSTLIYGSYILMATSAVIMMAVGFYQLYMKRNDNGPRHEDNRS